MEPVPAFQAFIRLGIALNGHRQVLSGELAPQFDGLNHRTPLSWRVPRASRVLLRKRVASNVTGLAVQMRIPGRGILGTASVGGSNINPGSQEERGAYSVTASTQTIDDLLAEESLAGERACGMKVDVEGFEPFVFRGAARMMFERTPSTLLVEYSPGIAESTSRRTMAPAYPALLRQFISVGYRIWQISGTGGSDGRGCGPKNDVRSWHFGKGFKPTWRFACPVVDGGAIAAEAAQAERISAGDFNVPWDLHPRSLHATFTHNTDLILSLNHSAIDSDGHVGLRPDSPFGLGGGNCDDTIRTAYKQGAVAEVIGRLCNPADTYADRASKIAARAKRIDRREAKDFMSITRRVIRESQQWMLELPPTRKAGEEDLPIVKRKVAHHLCLPNYALLLGASLSALASLPTAIALSDLPYHLLWIGGSDFVRESARDCQRRAAAPIIPSASPAV